MPKFLNSLRPIGSLARDTYLSTAILTTRLLTQMAWTILLARLLGPDGYGLLAGISALGLTLGTLTGLGFGVLLLQECSRDPARFAVLWKQTQVMASASGIVLLLLFVSIGPLLFHADGSWKLFLAIGVAELLCFPLVGIASQAFQAHQHLGWGSSLLLLPSFGNLLALALFMAGTAEPTVSGYVPYHAAGALLSAFMAVAWVWVRLSPARSPFVISRRDLSEGAGFSAMRLADVAQSSLDKVFVLMLGGNHAAGIYTAAYRLVSIATTPLISLSMSALPRLFRAGSDPQSTSISLVKRLVLVSAGYGVLAAAVIFGASSLLPLILGPQFQSAVEVSRWLAISPCLQGLYIVGANVLVTHHGRKYRLSAQCITILVMIALAVALIPRFGIHGAVATLLVTQCLSAILIWGAAGKLLAIRNSG